MELAVFPRADRLRRGAHHQLPRSAIQALRPCDAPDRRQHPPASTARKSGTVTPFQAAATALGSTVGTGNIVGVSQAIAMGGPGALFWLWAAALIGMIVKYVEVALAIYYRRGSIGSGPMDYITHVRQTTPCARLRRACHALRLLHGQSRAGQQHCRFLRPCRRRVYRWPDAKPCCSALRARSRPRRRRHGAAAQAARDGRHGGGSYGSADESAVHRRLNGGRRGKTIAG